MKIILASGSEWRKKLLSWLEIPFEVVVSGIDEKRVKVVEPAELVETLAQMKAEEVAGRLFQPRGGEGRVVVIGADTVIVVRGKPLGDIKILGKPADDEQAWEILSSLRGKEHEVWTGVCLIDSEGNQKVISEKTGVTFRDYSDEELKRFMETNEWVGKAGAYQIMGEISKFVEKIEGSFTSIIGLPLVTVADLLKESGVEFGVDVKAVVKEKTGYES